MTLNVRMAPKETFLDYQEKIIINIVPKNKSSIISEIVFTPT